MTNHNIHTVKHGDGWANRREGSQRVFSEHRTQERAIEQGRAAARRDHVEHLIHGRNGRVRERNSYGNDPHPPPG